MSTPVKSGLSNSAVGSLSVVVDGFISLVAILGLFYLVIIPVRYDSRDVTSLVFFAQQ